MASNPLLDFLAERAADPNENPLKRRVAAHAVAQMPRNILDVLASPVTGPAETLGLGLEAAGNTAKTIAGYAALPAVAVQADIGDPNHPITQYAQAMVGTQEGDRTAKTLEYLRHPGRQIDKLRESPDPATSWLAGGLEMAADPTNLIPIPAGAAGKLLRLNRAQAALKRLLKMADDVPGNVPADKLIPGIGRRGKPGIGPLLPPIVAPELPPLNDVPLPPELGPLLEDFLRGNAKRRLGPDLPPVLGPPSPGSSRLPELYGRRGNAGKVLGPPAPPEASPLLLDLAPPARPTAVGAPPAPDPLLTPAASYDDFLKAARKVTGDLPAPTASYWAKLGADPATVRSFFERGMAENLLGQTDDLGTVAVKPGALARYVPTNTRQMVDRWVEEAYGKGAFKAWPNLLKKLGADLTPEGVYRGEQDITGPVLSYLGDRADITSKPAAAARYQQLLDEIAPAVDEAVPGMSNVDIAPVVEDIAASAAPKPASAQDILNFQRLSGKERAARTGDVYLDQRLPKVLSGIDRNGNEIYRYPHTPDYFLTSAMSGRRIRHYIELPNGARVHPDEVTRLTVDTRTGAIRDRATGKLVQAGTENIPTSDELTQAKAALNAIGDRLDRAPTNKALQAQWDQAKRNVWKLESQIGSAAFKAGVPVEQLPSVTPPSLRTTTYAPPAATSGASVPTVEEVMARVPQRGVGRMERGNGKVETWARTKPEDLAVALHEAGITRSGDSAPAAIVAKRFADLRPEEAAIFFGDRYTVGSGLRTVRNFLNTLKEAAPAALPNTPTGSLPGVDMRPQFGGAALTSIADAPVTQAAAPLKLEMQYGGLDPNAVQRIKQVDAGQGDLFDNLADDVDDDAGRMLDEQLQLIEASPYFHVFKHFTPSGELKKVNPITGQRLTLREGGKFSRGRAQVWNIPGSGYDEVAANAMESVGGYNPANAPSADDFWDRAQQAFRQYKQLKRGNEINPADFAGDIAAGGGGGGGMGIVHPAILNMPDGVATTMLGSGVGGLSGAGAGAAAGFATGEGDFGDRLGNAKEGAFTGAILGMGVGGLGGATLGKNTSGQALRHIVQRSNEAGVAGTKLALAGGDPAAARGGATELAKGGLRYWAGQVVRHPKNIFNDELWNDLVTGALTPRSRQFLKAAREGLAARASLTDEWDRLPQSTMDLLALEGIDKAAWQAAEKLHGKGKGLQSLLNLGTPLSANLEDGALSMAKEIGYSTGLSVLNPQGFGQNLLGVIAGGPVKGAVNTYWRQFFNASNGILNNSFRHAALAGEAGKFRALGRQALIDSGETGFAQFADDGMFSTAEVARQLGPREAALWAGVQQNARELAQERVRFLYGDYGKKGFVENALGKMGIPFVSWAMRAYPVAAEMALTHPVIALALYHATRALAEGAGEDGRPGYTAGMIPLPDKAGLLTGGQGNTTYLDVIGSISPVGGEAFKGAEETSYDKNAYQSVQDGLSRVGLPGFGPVPAALAYIMGFDFKGPSALSRTQGLENSLGLIPGNPNLPDLGGGGLRAARGLVSPLVADTEIGALLGADADPTPEQYDPIGRRYAELVLEATGRRLNDPANQRHLLDLAFGRGELYARAERETLIGGAARNVASLSSPVGMVAQTEAARRSKVATSGNPASYQAVQAVPQGTAPRRAIEAQRKQYLAANPWAEPYSIGGRAEAEATIMEQILARYRRAGVRPTQAGIQEQIRLMTERANTP